jgi:hypothetical protein
VVGELGLVGAAAANAHAAAFTAGHRCSVRQRHRGVTAIQPITKAPGAVPYWKPRANKADSSFPVLNLVPKAGRSVATFDTREARPEQSTPASESPPRTYGVPDIC